MSLLSAQNLAKSFKDRRVVNDVSLQIESGEVVGLLGPNGAGKTTSFYMIVGLIQADQGEIFIDDQNVTDYPIHIRARLGVGYLPQEASIFRKLSVKDNVLGILQTRKDLNKSQQTDVMESLLGELKIGHLQDSFAISLSGGERRRLEIARALAANPQFILLDEPFAGVDPKSVIDIQQIISHLSERGIGVLITDHNVRETLGICEKAYIISAGDVIAHGTTEEILKNKEVRDVYLGHDFKM
ncbi:MAG: LPS export ABC transporter ATP-binding protein [Methylococcales bacterium]|jgi:lipopolysaccharide export system ATP-binding protein|nr:LPS export ABC transporter ATP-binding protein [Methylococcales bacterium]MBT7410490.1 LPS export ABC transporter ATP-binding protein [Methylococcales bacterium]